MKKFSFVSLGCEKNRIDSEIIIGELTGRGFQLIPEQNNPDFVIINTCAFLKEARQEALETIKQFTRAKKMKTNKMNKVVVIGCLAQYIKEFGRGRLELPDVDLTVPVDRMHKIPELIGKITSSPVQKGNPDEFQRGLRRFLTTNPHSVNIKIADGCANHCNYCLIPSIRGPLRSRSMEDIIAEIQAVEKLGAREINLIGQDITLYGSDLYGAPSLPGLLKRLLASLATIRWVRLLYAHPARISDDLITLMAKEQVLCSYLDMPIQHSNSKILRLMGRKLTREDLSRTYHRLREGVPGMALRTTVMTGYPGESEQDFHDLLDFLYQHPFDRLGGFVFSPERGTRSFQHFPRVNRAVSEMRLNKIMQQQKAISKALNRQLLGKTIPVLIDSCNNGQKKAYGRLYSQAPGVDGKVIIKGKGRVKPGDFIPVTITGIKSYDFIGEITV